MGSVSVGSTDRSASCLLSQPGDVVRCGIISAAAEEEVAVVAKIVVADAGRHLDPLTVADDDDEHGDECPSGRGSHASDGRWLNCCHPVDVVAQRPLASIDFAAAAAEKVAQLDDLSLVKWSNYSRPGAVAAAVADRRYY